MMVRNAIAAPAMDYRMATMQMPGLRIPPRVRTIPSVRRRLPVAVICDPPLPMNIRHVVQNMDSQGDASRPTQNQRI